MLNTPEPWAVSATEELWESTIAGDYARRSGQLQMMAGVISTMSAGGSLVVEAPVGLGKSIAYGLPVIDAAGPLSRTVIATANIALQHQLANDLPKLAKASGSKAKVAMLKGINNYFCEYEYDESVKAGHLDCHKLSPGEERVTLGIYEDRMAFGSPKQLVTRSDIQEEVGPHFWSNMSTDMERCQGQRCPNNDTCNYLRLKEDAREADVLIVNYHLLLADLQCERGIGGVLGPYDVLVCDEAHELADIAREFFGFSCSLASIKKLGRWLHGKSKLDAERLNRVAVDVFTRLHGYFASSTEPDKFRLLEPLDAPLADLLDALSRVRMHYDRQANEAEQPIHQQLAKVRAKAVTKVIDTLPYFEKPPHPSAVHAVEFDGKDVTIRGFPLSVADDLKNTLFSHNGEAPRTVILTSATLAVEGSFQHLKNETGIDPRMELIVPSPFDLKQQTAVFIDREAPAPVGASRVFHLDHMVERVTEIIQLMGGRTLVLFTSAKSLRYVYDRVAKKLNGQFELYRQGAGGNGHILRKFQEDVTSCLFGLDSFWSGIDVPGESLSCVVLEKIPFPAHTDPLVEALTSHYGVAGFEQVSLPRALTKFRQGCGRLIRHELDHGIYVLLDPRVETKGYGKAFLRTFPGVPLRGTFNTFPEAVKYFDEMRVVRRVERDLVGPKDDNQK